MSVFIIAEAGVNHGGSLDRAMDLVNAAKEAGADAVKFQAFTPERLDPPGERRDMLEKLKLSDGDFRVLAAHCRTVGIEFMATPFDPDWIPFLIYECGVQRIKIGSGNLDNEPLLEAAATSPCELIVSTGGATFKDVDDAVNLIGRPLTLLHCLSAYPAPVDEINLFAMRSLRDCYEHGVGLSLHTPSLALVAAATAIGIEAIEAHLCLSRAGNGPDLQASFTPVLFEFLVDQVRLVERAMGDGVKRPMPSEAKAIEIARERREWRERQTAA